MESFFCVRGTQNSKLQTTRKPIGLLALTLRSKFHRLSIPQTITYTNFSHFKATLATFYTPIILRSKLQTSLKPIRVLAHTSRSKFQRVSIPQTTTYSNLSQFEATFTALVHPNFFHQKLQTTRTPIGVLTQNLR